MRRHAVLLGKKFTGLEPNGSNPFLAMQNDIGPLKPKYDERKQQLERPDVNYTQYTIVAAVVARQLKYDLPVRLLAKVCSLRNSFIAGVP